MRAEAISWIEEPKLFLGEKSQSVFELMRLFTASFKFRFTGDTFLLLLPVTVPNFRKWLSTPENHFSANNFVRLPYMSNYFMNIRLTTVCEGSEEHFCTIPIFCSKVNIFAVNFKSIFYGSIADLILSYWIIYDYMFKFPASRIHN